MASSSPSPSLRKPPSCSPTTSLCPSKVLDSPCLPTFHPNQNLTMTPASHRGTPGLSGTRIQARGCQFVSLCTCLCAFLFLFLPFFFFAIVELESLWKIPKRLPECVHKNGCRVVCFSLRLHISLLPD